MTFYLPFCDYLATLVRSASKEIITNVIMTNTWGKRKSIMKKERNISNSETRHIRNIFRSIDACMPGLNYCRESRR